MRILHLMIILMFYALTSAAQDYGSVSKEPIAKGLYKVKSGDYYGIYDEKDNVIVSVEYDDIVFPNDSIALLKKRDGCAYGSVTITGNVTFFSKPFLYDPDYPFYSDGLIHVQNTNRNLDGRWFYIDVKGNPLGKAGKIFPMLRSYRNAMPFNEGYASVISAKGESIHIDKEGNERFMIENENVIYRSTVNCGEAVIITEKGIKLYQEDKTHGSYRANVKRVISSSRLFKVEIGLKGRAFKFDDGTLYLDYLDRAIEFIPIDGPTIRFMDQSDYDNPDEAPVEGGTISLTQIAVPILSLEDLSISLRQSTVMANSNGYASVTVQIENNTEVDSKMLTVKIVSAGVNYNETLLKISAGETQSIKLSLPAKFSDSLKNYELTVTVKDGEQSISKKLNVKVKRFEASNLL